MITKEQFLADTTEDELFAVIHTFIQYHNGKDGLLTKNRINMFDSEIGESIKAMLETYRQSDEEVTAIIGIDYYNEWFLTVWLSGKLIELDRKLTYETTIATDYCIYSRNVRFETNRWIQKQIQEDLS